jgi:hypothetical protein
MDIKIGDKVKIRKKTMGNPISEKEIGQIVIIGKKYNGWETRIRGNGSGEDEDNCIMINGNYFHPNDLEIINNNEQSTMTLKEKFLLALKSEPEKTFRKAGITNGDDMLTTEGTELFLNFLFEKNKTEFKKEVVDEIINEEK